MLGEISMFLNSKTGEYELDLVDTEYVGSDYIVESKYLFYLAIL
jgi:hypothetical protein